MYFKFTYSQYSYLRDGCTISVRPKTNRRLQCCTFNLTKLCNMIVFALFWNLYLIKQKELEYINEVASSNRINRFIQLSLGM